uniref:Uncharacterized protein ORF-c10_012 n=1 Tax=Saccharolobus solfataricus TaxID=2287 RepID=Q9UXA7_SACSO|nr:hypothetical protein [Saccharolobus solfataricus P2]
MVFRLTISSVTTIGKRTESLNTCPLALTKAMSAVALSALITANRFSLTFASSASFLFTEGGNANLPPTVLGAKAASPEFLTLGTLAIPRFIPKLSADVLLPALGSLPFGCSECVNSAINTLLIRSFLTGNEKIMGNSTSFILFPSLSKISDFFLTSSKYIHFHPC